MRARVKGKPTLRVQLEETDREILSLYFKHHKELARMGWYRSRIMGPAMDWYKKFKDGHDD